MDSKQRNTNIGLGIGVLLQLAGFLMFLLNAVTIGDPAWGMRFIVGVVLLLISIPVFIWGCMNYAEEKGYSEWVGIVAGVAGLTGLIVLALLPHQKRPDNW